MSSRTRFSWSLCSIPVAALVAIIGLPAPAAGQASGRIVGRILDAESGAPIAGAQVEVAEAPRPLRVTSAIDGRYALQDVPAGAVTLRVRLIGYRPKAVTGVLVPAGGVVEQDISLAGQVVELEELTVTAAAEGGSVARALDEQRTAPNIMNAVSAEQIGRSPDGDAGQAVQRVSGVSVQDGKYVVVRGLGERYTQTSLNGARIPSTEPERKVVPLDLFPSNLLEAVTTSKTFTPDQSGDFSGAQVDIRTREFPARSRFHLSIGSGYNSISTGEQTLVAPREQGDLFAIGASQREIPVVLAGFGNFLSSAPNQEQTNEIVNDFRNAWSPRTSTGAPPTSFDASLGGTAPVLGQPIGYLASLTYSLGWEAKLNQQRAQAMPGSETGSTVVSDHFSGSSARSSVLWGGILNLSTHLGSHSRLAFNNTLNRTADNEARSEVGFSENLAGNFRIERLAYVERSLRSHQLLGEHQLGERHRLDWSATASHVTRDEPDRSEFLYALETDPVTGNNLPPAWYSIDNQGAVRTFSELDEDNFEGGLNYRFSLSSGETPHQLRLGGLYRHTDRTADNTAYSIISTTLTRAERELAPEQIFDGRFAQPGDANFRLSPLGQGGSYSADDRLYAGYAMLDYAITNRLRFIGGARVERSEVEVRSQSTTGDLDAATPTYTDLLPSAALNYQLGGNHMLRLAASQTLARPEYRELAEVQYREVLGGDNYRGNGDLKRTLIQNVDLRWEWYPNAGEVLSVGLFAKHFDLPIERIYKATSGTRVISFENADAGQNLGAEFELRKRLGGLASLLAPFTFFGNLTLMDSKVNFAQGSPYAERSMVGQSPYVVNLGLGYTAAGSDLSATLLYNVQGRRIVSTAELPLPNVYEEARHVLDLSLRLPVTAGMAVKADVRNILDQPYEFTQGSVVRESYDIGRSFSLGFSWGADL